MPGKVIRNDPLKHANVQNFILHGVQHGSMTVEVEYNDRYDEWDIDSKAPNWIHTSANTRQAALKKARRLKSNGEDIKVKGPRMSRFKKV